jgi:3-keto-L-gulonate-6-phosphate decarboxylase
MSVVRTGLEIAQVAEDDRSATTRVDHANVHRAQRLATANLRAHAQHGRAALQALSKKAGSRVRIAVAGGITKVWRAGSLAKKFSNFNGLLS